MSTCLDKRKDKQWYRVFSVLLIIIFSFNVILPPNVAAQIFPLPVPTAMVSMTSAYAPVMIKGIALHPENPLQFDFIIDTGDSELQGQALKNESTKLAKYFLASLTVPEDELWVNLSPHEKNRIIPDAFGVTEMGRDLLAQDYILKQLTASLMYPEKELGRTFWDRVYQQVQEKYGDTQIPMDTFNKVWIVPEKAVVYQDGLSAFVVNSRLKVMLEQDYLAMAKSSQDSRNPRSPEKAFTGAQGHGGAGELQNQIMREIVIPAIEKEVNEGQHFANLRQIYHALILASWYKDNLKESLLGQVYVDQNKIKGIDLTDKDAKEKIYQKYVEAFKEGVYNYIKEEYDPSSKEYIPRHYFSGGTAMKVSPVRQDITAGKVKGPDQAMLVQGLKPASRASRFNRSTFKLLDIGPKAADTPTIARAVKEATPDPAMLGGRFNVSSDVKYLLPGLMEAPFDDQDSVKQLLRQSGEYEQIAKKIGNADYTVGIMWEHLVNVWSVIPMALVVDCPQKNIKFFLAADKENFKNHLEALFKDEAESRNGQVRGEVSDVDNRVNVKAVEDEFFKNAGLSSWGSVISVSNLKFDKETRRDGNLNGVEVACIKSIEVSLNNTLRQDQDNAMLVDELKEERRNLNLLTEQDWRTVLRKLEIEDSLGVFPLGSGRLASIWISRSDESRMTEGVVNKVLRMLPEGFEEQSIERVLFAELSHDVDAVYDENSRTLFLAERFGGVSDEDPNTIKLAMLPASLIQARFDNYLPAINQVFGFHLSSENVFHDSADNAMLSSEEERKRVSNPLFQAQFLHPDKVGKKTAFVMLKPDALDPANEGAVEELINVLQENFLVFQGNTIHFSNIQSENFSANGFAGKEGIPLFLVSRNDDHALNKLKDVSTRFDGESKGKDLLHVPENAEDLGRGAAFMFDTINLINISEEEWEVYEKIMAGSEDLTPIKIFNNLEVLYRENDFSAEAKSGLQKIVKALRLSFEEKLNIKRVMLAELKGVDAIYDQQSYVLIVSSSKASEVASYDGSKRQHIFPVIIPGWMGESAETMNAVRAALAWKPAAEVVETQGGVDLSATDLENGVLPVGEGEQVPDDVFLAMIDEATPDAEGDGNDSADTAVSESDLSDDKDGSTSGDQAMLASERKFGGLKISASQIDDLVKHVDSQVQVGYLTKGGKIKEIQGKLTNVDGPGGRFWISTSGKPFIFGEEAGSISVNFVNVIRPEADSAMLVVVEQSVYSKGLEPLRKASEEIENGWVSMKEYLEEILLPRRNFRMFLQQFTTETYERIEQTQKFITSIRSISQEEHEAINNLFKKIENDLMGLEVTLEQARQRHDKKIFEGTVLESFPADKKKIMRVIDFMRKSFTGKVGLDGKDSDQAMLVGNPEKGITFGINAILKEVKRVVKRAKAENPTSKGSNEPILLAFETEWEAKAVNVIAQELKRSMAGIVVERYNSSIGEGLSLVYPYKVKISMSKRAKMKSVVGKSQETLSVRIQDVLERMSKKFEEEKEQIQKMTVFGINEIWKVLQGSEKLNGPFVLAYETEREADAVNAIAQRFMDFDFMGVAVERYRSSTGENSDVIPVYPYVVRIDRSKVAKIKGVVGKSQEELSSFLKSILEVISQKLAIEDGVFKRELLPQIEGAESLSGAYKMPEGIGAADQAMLAKAKEFSDLLKKLTTHKEYDSKTYLVEDSAELLEEEAAKVLKWLQQHPKNAEFFGMTLIDDGTFHLFEQYTQSDFTFHFYRDPHYTGFASELVKVKRTNSRKLLKFLLTSKNVKIKKTGNTAVREFKKIGLLYHFHEDGDPGTISDSKINEIVERTGIIQKDLKSIPAEKAAGLLADKRTIFGLFNILRTAYSTEQEGEVLEREEESELKQFSNYMDVVFELIPMLKRDFFNPDAVSSYAHMEALRTAIQNIQQRDRVRVIGYTGSQSKVAISEYNKKRLQQFLTELDAFVARHQQSPDRSDQAMLVDADTVRRITMINDFPNQKNIINIRNAERAEEAIVEILQKLEDSNDKTDRRVTKPKEKLKLKVALEEWMKIKKADPEGYHPLDVTPGVRVDTGVAEWAEMLYEILFPDGGKKVGGINLDPKLLDMQIKRNEYGVPLPLPQQPLHELHIEGFYPVIIHTVPVESLPMLLGFLPEEGSPQDAGSNELSYARELDPADRMAYAF